MDRGLFCQETSRSRFQTTDVSDYSRNITVLDKNNLPVEYSSINRLLLFHILAVAEMVEQITAMFVRARVNSAILKTCFARVSEVYYCETFFPPLVGCYIGPFALFFVPFNFKAESRKAVQSSDIPRGTESQRSRCTEGAGSCPGRRLSVCQEPHEGAHRRSPPTSCSRVQTRSLLSRLVKLCTIASLAPTNPVLVYLKILTR